MLDWAKTCCSEGGILERNFSVLGPEENSGPEIILKDSMRDYKLHASGRRNCLGLLAELDLLPRQDLFQRLYYQVRLSASVWSCACAAVSLLAFRSSLGNLVGLELLLVLGRTRTRG